jgi:prefoldin subunit 5
MPLAPHKLMLNYTASFYDKKINQMESFITRLGTHLNTLENLRNQLNSQDFFAGPAAVEYYGIVGDQIRAVRNAQDNVMRARQTYQEAKDDIEKTRSGMDIDLSDITGVIGGLGIKK